MEYGKQIPNRKISAASAEQSHCECPVEKPTLSRAEPQQGGPERERTREREWERDAVAVAVTATTI